MSPPAGLACGGPGALYSLLAEVRWQTGNGAKLSLFRGAVNALCSGQGRALRKSPVDFFSEGASLQGRA